MLFCQTPFYQRSGALFIFSEHCTFEIQDYTYAHNNPVKFVDSDGHMIVALPLFFVPGIGWIAGGIITIGGGIFIGLKLSKLRKSRVTFNIPNSLLKKDKKTVNLGKFTNKVKGKVASKDPKTKWIIEKDTAGHLGKKWKSSCLFG